MTFDTSSTYTLDAVRKTMLPKLEVADRELSGILRSLPANPGASDLLELQAAVSRASLSANLHSGLIKELGDTLKSIVQKAA